MSSIHPLSLKISIFSKFNFIKIGYGPSNNTYENECRILNFEPEVPQVVIDLLAEQVAPDNVFKELSQAMTDQPNSEVIALVKPNVGETAKMISDFTNINPLDFHGSKVKEDPQELIDEMYKIVGIMGFSVTTRKYSLEVTRRT
ncbi:uncharacterized protein LOC114076731 [Solanum pennellii]|uniref:Uncharacterized protein LOC114076731 n=1 Tax=Solanum pennellii TaxID=28526 RepID=A0ABM1V7Z3_SOLPN|nr:uncharacterized protein LOC114076731 [Solanum pennellii]